MSSPCGESTSAMNQSVCFIFPHHKTLITNDVIFQKSQHFSQKIASLLMTEV